MIILAMRGRGKNLVIDRNSIVKNEKLKILTKTHDIYIKRKLQNMQNPDSGRKSMICYQ